MQTPELLPVLLLPKVPAGQDVTQLPPVKKRLVGQVKHAFGPVE